MLPVFPPTPSNLERLHTITHFGLFVFVLNASPIDLI